MNTGNGQTTLSDRHKEAVKSWVPKVRKVLEKDLAAQLGRLGIKSDGKHTPVDSMNLPAEASATRERVDALLRRDSVAEGGPKRGYENVLREFTYTALNRLVGLKAMEVRGLLYLPPPGGGEPEQTEVLTPIQGQDRSRYIRDFRAAGGSRYKYEDDAEEALLRDGLESAYRHITREIRLLFDPDHEYACVWPTHACLVQVIGAINTDLPDDAYRASDFLGWVYQFFVGRSAPGEKKSEKQRIRDETGGKPRSSYELSVINQFYTPSWVVKALVDNTLGRLWLQMHPDSRLRPVASPSLPARPEDAGLPGADYLVPRTGEHQPYERRSGDGNVLSFKRARDITLLDPACGTMHFGQYAFGLFQQMYLEEIQHAGEVGWPAEPSVSDAAQIPVAILENNLFGVDIDARAIQIASLSLMLTAKEAGVSLGLSPVDVEIRRANLVVANAVDLGKDCLKSLVGRLRDKMGSSALQDRLFGTLWENLQHVGELGSLLQVRETVSAVLGEWVEAQARARGLVDLVRRKEARQLLLGNILDEADKARAHQLVLQRAMLEEEAQEIQRDLLAALEDAAGETVTDPAERLFAEDTVRGIKLLQTLSRSFDVVVMNPPYGSTTKKTTRIVDELYPIGRNDIYCAFVERGARLLEPEGYLGALTSRSFFSGPRSIDFRRAILGSPWSLVWMADLGAGILDDATVSTAAYVISPKERSETATVTIHDLDCHPGEREQRFVESLRNFDGGPHCYSRELRFFRGIADHRLAYNLYASLDHAFSNFEPLFPEYLKNPACVGANRFQPAFVAVVQGMIPVPLDRFVRYEWEPSHDSKRTWIPIAKGGDFGRFYYKESLVVDWTDDGHDVKEEARRRYGSVTRTIKNTRYFGREGLTFPRVSSLGFSCRRMPSGAAFTDKGQLIFCRDPKMTDSLLGVLNSELVITTLQLLSPSRFTEVNDLALLPVPRKLDSKLGEIAVEIEELKREWSCGMEPHPPFADSPPPAIVAMASGGIEDRLTVVLEAEEEACREIAAKYGELNERVEECFRISQDDRARVRSLAGRLPKAEVWQTMSGKSISQKRMEHVWRLLSFAVRRVVEADEDGIVPYSAAGGEAPLIERVLRELAVLFPKQDINQVEIDIANELNRKIKGYQRVKSIEEWLADVFFDYHTSLYMKRPIIWHIASSQKRGDFCFGALVHFHKFDGDRMAKLRGSYLHDAIAHFRREAGLAGQEGRTDDRQEWQAMLEEAEALDERLKWVQEGINGYPADGDCRILTPWKAEDERPKGWNPDIDDGVAVNIEPLQTAGVLRIGKVV